MYREVWTPLYLTKRGDGDGTEVTGDWKFRLERPVPTVMNSKKGH